MLNVSITIVSDWSEIVLLRRLLSDWPFIENDRKRRKIKKYLIPKATMDYKSKCKGFKTCWKNYRNEILTLKK